MTADFSRSRHRVFVPLLVLVTLGAILRFRFVDLLTKVTGTWIGGVESPHRAEAQADTAAKSPSAS